MAKVRRETSRADSMNYFVSCRVRLGTERSKAGELVHFLLWAPGKPAEGFGGRATTGEGGIGHATAGRQQVSFRWARHCLRRVTREEAA